VDSHRRADETRTAGTSNDRRLPYDFLRSAWSSNGPFCTESLPYPAFVGVRADQIEAESRERVAELIRSAGVRVDAESRELAGLVVAAIRGLSIEAMFRKGSGETPAALHVLQSLMQMRFLPQAPHSVADSRELSRGTTPSRGHRKTRL
jgi:hypothetical protein